MYNYITTLKNLLNSYMVVEYLYILSQSAFLPLIDEMQKDVFNYLYN